MMIDRMRPLEIKSGRRRRSSEIFDASSQRRDVERVGGGADAGEAAKPAIKREVYPSNATWFAWQRINPGVEVQINIATTSGREYPCIFSLNRNNKYVVSDVNDTAKILGASISHVDAISDARKTLERTEAKES